MFLAAGSLLMVYGADGSGKSTWTIDGIVHLAAGEDWLGIPVPRPVRCCVDRERGAAGAVPAEARREARRLGGRRTRAANLFVYAAPWGEFTFADPEARAALTRRSATSTGSTSSPPTRRSGSASARRAAPMRRSSSSTGSSSAASSATARSGCCTTRTSGADLRRLGPAPRHVRAAAARRQPAAHEADWAKTRWATLDPDEKAVLLEWVVEAQGYNVVALDAVGATDDELDERIVDYLTGTRRRRPRRSRRTSRAPTGGSARG